jgi:hypothetical protein
MDYEVLLAAYTETQEQLKACLAQQQKLLKRIGKSMEAGDLKSAVKDTALFDALSRDTAQMIETITNTENSADMAEYLESGDFAAQLVAACEARGIDIIGEEGSYEIFPYRLKINAAEEEVLINGKKTPGLRPLAIASLLETGRSKLLAANFNPEKFAAELAAAYDIAVVHTAKGKTPKTDADVYLSTLYKYLAPMARFRKDYGMQSYAFDIARLYSAGDVSLADGRRIQFGPSRNNNRAIRILDSYGKEYFLATVRFFCE